MHVRQVKITLIVFGLLHPMKNLLTIKLKVVSPKMYIKLLSFSFSVSFYVKKATQK